MAEANDLLLVLVLGAGIAWLSDRFKFPSAVAQVVLGVVLGAAVLGWVAHGTALHALGEIGVVLLLGVAGLELGVERLRAAGWGGAVVAALGVVFSLVGGYSLGWLYGSPSDEAFYLALVLAATSIGITFQVLQQFGLIAHRVADVVIAAAVIDDVIALYLLGAAHGFLSDGLAPGGVVGYAVLAMIALGSLYAISNVATRLAKRRGLIIHPWLRSVWIVSAIGGAALLTQALDLSAVVGAFFAGLGVGEGLGSEERERSATTLLPMVFVTMPFFFVMIGVQARWDILKEPALLWLVAGLISIGVTAKAAGGVLGALGCEAWAERWLIGFGMVPRGEIGLIIATLGLEQGHLTHDVFVALVLTTIVLSALGPLLMFPFAKRLTPGVPFEVGGAR